MKRTLTAILVLMFAVAAFAAPGARRGPAAGGGPGGGGPQAQRGGDILPPQMLAEFLDLSEAQITQAQALRESLRQSLEPLREQLRANRQALRDAVEAGNAQTAGELLIAGHAIGQQMKALHDGFAAQFEAMLTPDQKEKWAVYKELMELRRHRPDDEE